MVLWDLGESCGGVLPKHRNVEGDAAQEVVLKPGPFGCSVRVKLIIHWGTPERERSNCVTVLHFAPSLHAVAMSARADNSEHNFHTMHVASMRQ